MTTNFSPYEAMDKPMKARAEDRGKARDVRDYLIGETADGVAHVETLVRFTSIGVGRSRLERIVEVYDWFEHRRRDDRPAIAVTEHGHRALRDDELREYDEIACQGSTEVAAGD